MPEHSKIVIVTGGSSGIGKDVAAKLLARGDTVVVVSHSEPRLMMALEELRAISPSVRAYRCDVRNGGDIKDVVDRTLAEFGRIDVLVNNAGYAVYRTFEESSLEEVIDLLDVNLVGVVRFTKAVIPSMKRTGGRIVNVSSIAGQVIITPNSSYCASKHAVVALSEALRVELERFGIQVCVVCPGRVETPFFDHETFRMRAPRPETGMTVPIDQVSAAIIEALDSGRFMTYVPRNLALVSWLLNAAPMLLRPLYHIVLRRRIRSHYRRASTSAGIRRVNED